MHDISLNRTYDILVCQPNVALTLMSKIEVSLDEGTDVRLALDDATLQSQSR